MSAVVDEPRPAQYWESRAARFARIDHGLPAICSYGMPLLYNRAIDLCQRRALAPFLERYRGADVLDVGCGVGRWSLRLARRNHVVGVDLSPTMIDVAREHAANAGHAARFEVGDVTTLDLGAAFDVVLSVTVLQHVLADDLFEQAIRNLAAHLKPGGCMLLLEVAPRDDGAPCRSPVFRPRSIDVYARTLSAAAVELESVVGVDVGPLRPFLLPLLPALPPFVGRAALTAATLASLPIDLCLSRGSRRSWHKLLVARRRAA
jgi:2-polyprenyl-3-methyl-5-hydroxy-6-metoxy-1,4-benzoquinol methylase